jgi:zinc protease
MSARADAGSPPVLGKIDHRGSKAFYHYEKEAGKTRVAIGVISPHVKQKDSPAQRRRNLLESMANQIVQYRINAVLNKPDAPFTSAYISSGEYFKVIRYGQISAETSPQNWEASLMRLEQILRQTLTFGFTRTEVERAQKDFMAELDRAVNKAPTRNSQKLARKIMADLSANRVFQSPQQEKSLLAPMVASATPSDLLDAIQRVWSKSHRLLLITGDADLNAEGESVQAQILAAAKKSQKITVTRPLEEKPVVFPYMPPPAGSATIVKREKVHDLDVLMMDFDNGVRLNVKQTDFKADQVLLKMVFGQGRSSEPPDKPGLAELSRRVINESGLGALTKDELARALAGKQTHIHFGVEDGYFHFSGETVSAEIDLLFQLLYAHIADPGFRPDAYTRMMEQFRQQYQKLSASIDGGMLLFGSRFLASGDSRFGLPPFNQLQKYTLDAIRTWIGPILKRDRLEISVVGDIDPEAVVSAAAKYFGRMPKRSDSPAIENAKQPTFPAAGTLKISVDTKIPKGLVVVAYPTDDFNDIQRSRRLSVLGQVFSDRLRERVRETMGAAYSAYAFNQSSRVYPGYGVFQSRIKVDPQQVALIVDEVKNITAEIGAGGIEIDELRRALDPLLTEIKESRRKNGYWLNLVLAGSSRHPDQLDWSRTILADYGAITVQQLEELARRYLKNEKAAAITIFPSPKGESITG